MNVKYFSVGKFNANVSSLAMSLFNCIGASIKASLSSKPRLYELDMIKGNGKTVKVFSRTAACWERLATRLHFEGHEIKTIRADNQQCEDACRNMCIEWLEGKGREPKTWQTLLTALKEADFGEVASDLADIFSEF